MLAATIPDWFETIAASGRHLEGLAKLPGTVWHRDGIALRITLGSRPAVSEMVAGTHLPAQCPERHLYADSSFCMALHAQRVQGRNAARIWWDHLAQYLLCQSTAHETGLWPLHNGLDHGSAAGFHARALEFAEQLGVLDEYYGVHAGLAEAFSPETTARLEHVDAFKTLSDLEARRREAVENYKIMTGVSGQLCCGTMRECALPKDPAADALPCAVPALSAPSLRATLLATTKLHRDFVWL